MSKNGKSWSIGLFIFYVVFMIVLIGVVIYSTQNNVELVTNNYYEKTLVYEDQIQAINNTKSLAQKPVVAVDKVQQQIFLVMPKIYIPETNQGKILFFRPSDSHLDFSVPLNCNMQNQQTFPLQKMASGKWKVQLTWTDGIKKYYYEQVIFI